MDRHPIFLIGCMRSGTTLLSRLLSMHPQIVPIGFELNDVWTEIGNAPCDKTCEFRDATHLSEDYRNNMERYFEQQLRKSKTLRSHVGRTANYFRYNYGRVSYDWRRAIVLNKSPHLMNKVGYLNSMFPRAHFILIIRDIYGHSSSQKVHFDLAYEKHGRQRFMPESEKGCWSYVDGADLPKENCYPGKFELIPQMWLRLNNLAIKELDKIESGKVSIISYEKLIENQSGTMQNLYSQLPLNAEHNSLLPGIAAKKVTVKNTTTEGDSIIKWKQELDESQKKTIRKAINENQDVYEQICNRVAN